MKLKRILIVDDERLTRLALADFLQELHYETVAVGDGESAIQMQRKRTFDVCIVDIRMPGIDGVETILALHDISNNSRFLVCTGSPQFIVPPALQTINITSWQVIYKPILDMDVFVSLIERLLNTSNT